MPAFRFRETAAFVAAMLALLPQALSASGLEDSPVRWRPYGAAAFREAAESRRPIFLVLTAPWNWDHFLLAPRLFDRKEIHEPLNEDWIPVLADASIHPELRRIYSIQSGLLPSFHFLDSSGRHFASSAPLGPEEVAFRLTDWQDPSRRPEAAATAERVTFDVKADKFANRIARYLADLSERGELPVAPVHQDIDPGALLFLAEAGESNVPRRAAETLARELGRLRASTLQDPVDGGFHRAAALADLTLPHFEKTLRLNARMGALLAVQFRRTASEPVGRDALLVLRLLNEGLRDAQGPLYAESMAADLFDATERELKTPGREYYEFNAARRQLQGRPRPSDVFTVGGNGAVLSAFAIYAAVFNDMRVVDAARRITPRLLAEGFLPDGRARAQIGGEEPAGLLGQADAGLGLLAGHAMTGNPDALEAAERIATSLAEHYLDAKTGLFRDVPRDTNLPDVVQAALPDAAANGIALRLFADLAAMTRERRWLEIAQRGIEAWSSRAPADGRGLGELAGAAHRVNAPSPLLLLRAEPGTAEAERLLGLARGLRDPWNHVRWVRGEEIAEVEQRFGVEIEGEPALYLVSGPPSGALRDGEVLHAVYREALERAAGG